MIVFQKLERKTTALNFWNQKLEGNTATLKNWIQKMEGNSTTPKNCVLTNFLHESSGIFFLVFSLVWFWILLRNEICIIKFSFKYSMNKWWFFDRLNEFVSSVLSTTYKLNTTLEIRMIFYHFSYSSSYLALKNWRRYFT